MRRYFYNDIKLFSKWLQKNALAKVYQDSIYRSAFLAAHRNDPKNPFDQLREHILNMTIQQQLKYSNNYHIQCIFSYFYTLHRFSRGKQMIVDSNKSKQTTELVDPDKFPIWDLKKYSSVYKSLWGNHLAQIRYQIGQQAIIRQSQVQHPAAGRGAYMILPKNKEKIKVGKLLGFVPGKIYETLNDFKTIIGKNRKNYHKDPQHLHFPSGKILQLGDISFKKLKEGRLCHQHNQFVDATFHNPYAFGHMINHPPPGYQPNVAFTQMNIQSDYFPSFLLKYLPYEYFNDKKKGITLFGIFSIKQIEHMEEMFVNYNESHIYPIQDIPQWLIQPSKSSPIFSYLKKGEYELPQSSFWSLIEKKALQKNKQLFQKYQKQTVFRPDKIQFQSNGKKYRKMKTGISDQNQYEHL